MFQFARLALLKLKRLLAAMSALAGGIARQVSRSWLSREMRAKTSLIGLTGSVEVLAHYISNYDTYANDARLHDFMRFYAENWNLSSSQWSQDVFVMYAANGKRCGRFLEIGGADGYTHSNTYSLEKCFDWRGTLVEPDPRQFRVLKRARSENTLVHAAISPNGIYGFQNLRLAGQLSALEDHEGKDMHIEARLKSQSFSRVSTISLTTLLRDTAFDYLSLDVEGAELDIVKSVNWNLVKKPQILTIEHNFRDDDRAALSKILKEQGYIEHFAHCDWLRRGDVWATLSC